MVVFGLNTIIVFLSPYWSARMTQRRRERERRETRDGERKESDTSFSERNEKRLASL